MDKYTIVTVAHQTDYEALCLQASSMCSYVSPKHIERIIVIENTKLNDHDKLLNRYGKLKPLVQIVEGTSLAPPETFTRTGWYSQQILKLAVSSIVMTPRYIALDAKNVLVYPLKPSFLERKGKPLSHLADYTTHSSMRWLRNTFVYFGLPESHATAFMPTTTPFVLVTDLVKALVRHIERREGASLTTAFERHSLTEFFLYAGYLIATNQMCYDFSGAECKAVWDTRHSDEYVHTAITRTERNKLPFFSVHRRAIPLLSPAARQEIIAFYKRRGIDASIIFT